jgi:hypothetical protein
VLDGGVRDREVWNPDKLRPDVHRGAGDGRSGVGIREWCQEMAKDGEPEGRVFVRGRLKEATDKSEAGSCGERGVRGV